jgi:hypothetical protein
VVEIPFTESQVAESAVNRSSSLEAVGGSFAEVAFKLLAVAVVYSAAVGVFVLKAVLDTVRDADARTGDTTVERRLFLYVVGGFTAMVGLFGVYVVMGTDQAARHYAFIVAIVSVLGAVAIGRGVAYAEGRGAERVARPAVAVAFVVFLALSILVVFPSPYIYYDSNHVTENHMKGYETTFEHEADAIPFDNVRSTTSRYGNAIVGPNERPREAYYGDDDRRGDVPDRFADHALRSYYDQRTYLPVTEADRVRDPVLWRGFRFSHEDFAYLDAEPGIDKVQADGGYDLYLVQPEERIEPEDE